MLITDHCQHVISDGSPPPNVTSAECHEAFSPSRGNRKRVVRVLLETQRSSARGSLAFLQSTTLTSYRALILSSDNTWERKRSFLMRSLRNTDVDVSRLGGAVPQAVKYAWGSTGGTLNDQDVVCCAAGSAPSECIPGQGPIFAESSTAPLGAVPANPFLAEIVNGKCVCPPSQRCDN